MQPRRRLIVAIVGGLLAAPLTSIAQRRPTRSIGFLSPFVPQNGSHPALEAFRRGMSDLGHVEGNDYRLAIQWGEGRLERLPELAAELVRTGPAIIVAVTPPAVLAAREATRTIPIVTPTLTDPVAEGLAASLARPGGNITGLSLLAPELGAKRLQLLKEVLPPQSRNVAVVWNPSYKGMTARFEQTKAAGPALDLQVRSLEVRDSREMEAAFDAVSRRRPDGVLFLADPLTSSLRLRIVEFAREKRLPAIYEGREYVEAGGLMSYGPNMAALNHRAASYVDRILKGARPGDLPIEQPTRIEMLVNLGTARALGLKLPRSILASANEALD